MRSRGASRYNGLMNDPAAKLPSGSPLDNLRLEARLAPESGIVEVVNYGRLKPGLIPLWTEEGDLPTPAFIAEAATRSLAAGETFYTWQRGIPELREALARYHAALYAKPFSAEQFFVTGSGMQADRKSTRLNSSQIPLSRMPS